MHRIAGRCAIPDGRDISIEDAGGTRLGRRRRYLIPIRLRASAPARQPSRTLAAYFASRAMRASPFSLFGVAAALCAALSPHSRRYRPASLIIRRNAKYRHKMLSGATEPLYR